jgi:hypothetical protein
LKSLDAFAAQQDGPVHNSFKIIFSTFNPGVTAINLFTSYNYGTDMFADRMSVKQAAFGFGLSVVPFGIGIKAAKTGTRAFFSGAGTETKAIKEGFQTLGQTKAGRNLQNLIDNKNIPWSQAEPMWQRLSATWAKGVPNGSTINVFLNNPRAGAVWFKTELPILQQKGVNIIYR